MEGTENAPRPAWQFGSLPVAHHPAVVAVCLAALGWLKPYSQREPFNDGHRSEQNVTGELAHLHFPQ